uniref:Capsid protein n=1 Tax=Wenling rattails astrovirus 1 TaxID=2116135 RepID=A0A2P1GME5_9VIRU|nr:capsid protein [Wenling rattails astrovirus 1]
MPHPKQNQGAISKKTPVPVVVVHKKRTKKRAAKKHYEDVVKTSGTKGLGMSTPRGRKSKASAHRHADGVHEGEGTYEGSSKIGDIHGNPSDEYTCSLSVGSNPQQFADKVGDNLLKLELHKWSKYRIVRMDVRLIPVVSETAATGSIVVVTMFENVGDPKGPKDINDALKSHHQLGKMGREIVLRCGGSANKWHNIDPRGEPTEYTEYYLCCGLSGKTTAVFQNTGGVTEWNGNLFQVFCDYKFIFTGAKDAQDRPTLDNEPASGASFTLTGRIGEPLVLSTAAPAFVAKRQGYRRFHLSATETHSRSRGILGDVLHKGISLLTGLIPGLKPTGSGLRTAPTPTPVNVHAGAVILREKKTDPTQTGQPVQWNMYRTLMEAENDQPLVSTSNDTTPLYGNDGAMLSMVANPDPTAASESGGGCGHNDVFGSVSDLVDGKAIDLVIKPMRIDGGSGLLGFQSIGPTVTAGLTAHDSTGKQAFSRITGLAIFAFVTNEQTPQGVSYKRPCANEELDQYPVEMYQAGRLVLRLPFLSAMKQLQELQTTILVDGPTGQKQLATWVGENPPFLAGEDIVNGGNLPIHAELWMVNSGGIMEMMSFHPTSENGWTFIPRVTPAYRMTKSDAAAAEQKPEFSVNELMVMLRETLGSGRRHAAAVEVLDIFDANEDSGAETSDTGTESDGSSNDE